MLLMLLNCSFLSFNFFSQFFSPFHLAGGWEWVAVCEWSQVLAGVKIWVSFWAPNMRLLQHTTPPALVTFQNLSFWPVHYHFQGSWVTRISYSSLCDQCDPLALCAVCGGGPFTIHPSTSSYSARSCACMAWVFSEGASNVTYLQNQDFHPRQQDLTMMGLPLHCQLSWFHFYCLPHRSFVTICESTER